MTTYRGYRAETTRLPGWDYRDSGWYFITICTQQHACTLGEVEDLHVNLSPIGLVAASELDALPGRYSSVVVDAFVIMPNHVHAIMVIDGLHRYSPAAVVAVSDEASDFPRCGPKPCSLGSIVRAYKAGVIRWCRVNGYAWFAWQAGFYDRILRSNASVNAVRDYIHRNPASWLFDRDHPRNLKTLVET